MHICLKGKTTFLCYWFVSKIDSRYSNYLFLSYDLYSLRYSLRSNVYIQQAFVYLPS